MVPRLAPFAPNRQRKLHLGQCCGNPRAHGSRRGATVRVPWHSRVSHSCAAHGASTGAARSWTITMAKRNYLVEGLSGAGKSSVYEELVRRGYKAISTDRAWACHADPDTGLPGGPIRHDTFMWDQQKAVSELESPEPEVLFVCGSSRNRDRFLPYFTKIFNLRIDDDTMRRRLQERTDDDWPLGQEGVELMLTLNRSDEKPAGAIDVDATQPLHQVVDELLRLANCRTVTSDSVSRG